MKTLRFSLIVSLLLGLSIQLTGCIVIPNYKYYDDIDTANVTSVQIYDLRNVDVRDSRILDTHEPVYTLSPEQLESFWDDLASIRFNDPLIITIAAIDPSFGYDVWVVRINYADNTFSLISSGGFNQTFDENNQAIDSNHYNCDDEEWNKFIGRYLPAELFKEQISESGTVM